MDEPGSFRHRIFQGGDRLPLLDIDHDRPYGFPRPLQAVGHHRRDGLTLIADHV